jgi:hypothetical protein
LVESLAKAYIVHLHSLNHDLYIEHLASSDSIQARLDDGFEELGSTYYGDTRDSYERYMVRLPRFTNKFDQPFRLYKLHGSIDHYWFQENDQLELIKLKRGVGKTDVFKEIKQDGKLKYINNPLYFYPDFLSGTTAKMRQYNRGAYYPTIFRHFENNLKSSKNLIIIGYGFADTIINHYIENVFLAEQHKKIFIVDIKEPSTELLKKENVYYIGGGVISMDTRSILNNLQLC